MQQRLPVNFNREEIREAFLMLADDTLHILGGRFIRLCILGRLEARDYIPRPSRPRLFLGMSRNGQAAYVNAWLHHLPDVPLPLVILQGLVDEWDTDQVAAILRPCDNISVTRCIEKGLVFWGTLASKFRIKGAGTPQNLVGAMLDGSPIILLAP